MPGLLQPLNHEWATAITHPTFLRQVELGFVSCFFPTNPANIYAAPASFHKNWFKWKTNKSIDSSIVFVLFFRSLGWDCAKLVLNGQGIIGLHLIEVEHCMHQLLPRPFQASHWWKWFHQPSAQWWKTRRNPAERKGITEHPIGNETGHSGRSSYQP